MEQYLTVKELSERLKLARQTIYNMIHKRDFILNRHYFKPTPKKILFKWSAMKNWLEGDGFDDKKISSHPDFVIENQQILPLKHQPTSCIKI